MRKLLLYLLLFASPLLTISQSTTQKETIPLPSDKVNWSTNIDMTDHLGRPFHKQYNGVEGHPYLFEDWKPAIGKNATGLLKGIEKIKFDILSQEVDCVVPGGDSMIVQDGFIKEFTLLDSLRSGKNYTFRSGYPSIDKNTVNTFYLVLSDGSLQLLKYSKKEIKIEKDDMSGATTKEFTQYDSYYIYRNGEMIKWKRDKDFVLELMKDQQKRIEEYSNKVKVNFKNPESAAVLFDYYNQPAKAF